ncbi:hypothetical protein LEP1GSC008_1174 [Leptospira kirschneri serovar Bulgarica str. Nikolaevo]|uniref:Uncharacterized protein n=1 Tax=Leptospira kirschneri serovar Bulgarica str. Nikolaevo TaxID=1240687 RepID=M6FAH8_9LEPT|nr:hypothetical protein LEP1GSC008_1174 [Leptospira kirschneri serovar Bulgarica str. Nikolaevo]
MFGVKKILSYAFGNLENFAVKYSSVLVPTFLGSWFIIKK